MARVHPSRYVKRRAVFRRGQIPPRRPKFIGTKTAAVVVSSSRRRQVWIT